MLKLAQRSVAIIYLVSIPIVQIPLMIFDLCHPKVWSDWRHNPSVFLPLWGLNVIGYGALFAYMYRVKTRSQRNRCMDHKSAGSAEIGT